ncbi:MAG: 50S ribosomal protein L10 [Candidatus Woesearchaeota archaeon]
MAHVSEYKKKRVKELAELIEKYRAVGIINMENLPAVQLQRMRGQLRDTILIEMSKKNLMKIAIQQSKKPGIEKLAEKLEGMPCFLFTNESPFRVAIMLKRSKSTAPAKVGQVAPKDIIIPAGPTQFTPGPVLGELGQLGVKAGVDKGKIVIKEDKLVAKKGEKITKQMATLLQKFGIEPMEIGLNLVAFYEDGLVYDSSVLDIDPAKTLEDIKRAASWAFNLSMECAYPTKENIQMLVAKAELSAKALSSKVNA